MIEVTLQRDGDNGVSAFGRIFIEGERQCFTVEPSLGRKEHPGILPGRYRLIWADSARLGRKTMRLVDVPAVIPKKGPVTAFRDGILIHAGNKATDSLGCIIVGTVRKNPDWVSNSKIALSALENKLLGRMSGRLAEECWITILAPSPETIIEQARRV